MNTITMNDKVEKKLMKIVQEEFPSYNDIDQFKQWFLRQFENCARPNDCNDSDDDNCTLEKFAIYFLNEIKQHTEIHLKVNAIDNETIKRSETIQLNAKDGVEIDVSETAKNSLILTSTPCKSDHILSASVSGSKSLNTLTPSKQQNNLNRSHEQQQLQRRQSYTSPSPLASPLSSSSHRNSTSPICLGDFLVAGSSRQQQKRRTPQSHYKMKKSNVEESTKNNSKSTEKPKKRVAPTTITTKSAASKKLNVTQNVSVFTGESSFSNENNLLQLADVLEIEDKQQCAILEARKILKSNPHQISEELANANVNKSNGDTSNNMTLVKSDLQNQITDCNRRLSVIDVQSNVKNPILLNKLAAIYSILIDLNITTNVLSELSYMINLCNANCITTITGTTSTSMTTDSDFNIGKKQLDTEEPEDDEKDKNYIALEQGMHDLSVTHNTQIKSIVATSKNFSDLLNISDAMYFISQVLSLQRNTFAQLDTASLNIILNSNCFHYYMTSDVKSYLSKILQYKLQLQTQKVTLAGESSMDQQRSDISNVHFQEDNNSREHFTSQQEFTNFRGQRDLFYKCFNIWEANHLNPQWNFSTELTPILKEIFNLSENYINMIHFAKLFVSQLLISAINVTPTPQEIGLADVTSVDQAKLQKLSQRLIAPSKFSRDYQFPRMESFFQQFIAEARSWPFLEQLKMELYAELLIRNNCTLSHINIYQHSIVSGSDIDVDVDSDLKIASCCHNFHNNNNNKNHDNCNCDCDHHYYYIVKRADMQSLLLLAKFLGYVISLPYMNVNIMNKDGNNNGNNNGNGGGNDHKIPIEIETNQIYLRNMMQCKFETSQILLDAMQNGKLLITLPWMVQYYAMLDDIALKLESNLKTLHLMFNLYRTMGLNNHNAEQYHFDYHDQDVIVSGNSENPTNVLHAHHHYSGSNVTALFIFRICLGWLFDGQHILSDAYYSYRAQVNDSRHSSDAKQFFNNEWEIIRKALAVYKMPSFQNAESKRAKLLQNFDSLLETMLTTICPFLAEFRVSIIPTWSTLIKNASRSGKYRYITPRLTELPTAATPAKQEISLSTNTSLAVIDGQTRLLQAFLHTLNSNARLLINFCIERCYKSVVKDGHYKILLPSKQTADALVNKIDTIDYHMAYRECSEIYMKAKLDALNQWNNGIPQMLQKRIDNVLEGLLPEETRNSILRKVYFYIIQQEAERKINDWIHCTMYRTDFYCPTINNLVNKICSGNKMKHEKHQQDKQQKPEIMACSAELRITQLEPSLSGLLENLQYCLHCTSVRQERFPNLDDVRVLLERLPETFQNPLPPLLYHAIVINTIQLMKHIICSNKAQLMDDIIQAACHIWLHPNVQNALTSLETTIYDGLITIPFIENVSITPGAYDQLEKLLIIMINKEIVHGDYISECFMEIFKHKWKCTVIQDLCKMLHNVAKVTNSALKMPSYPVIINHDNLYSK